jgi:hypothetical protein
VRASDLTGEAKGLYEQWRALGYGERAALDRVARSGLVLSADEEKVARSLQAIFGLTEGQATAAARGRDARASGPATQPTPMSVEERTARSLRKIFNLTEAQSLVAARGDDSGSSRPVSESLSSLRPDPANIPHVVAAIKEIASGLCREGVAEDKALRDAAAQVMLRVPDDRTADWVARVAQRFGLI